MIRKKAKYLTFRVGLLTGWGMLLYVFWIVVYCCLIWRYQVPVWPLILGLLLLTGLSCAVFWWLVKPYYRIERTLQLFLEGYAMTDMENITEAELTPVVHSAIEKMVGMMDSSELLKMNKRQAQYLALQNQINPHFLYNTLESIRSEALLSGLTSVSDMTEALATFFRYTISKVENLVSVEEELHNCETYLRIQKYRFGSRLNFTITCDPEERDAIYSCRLPKLTMQPILENSIIHGIECKIGSGHLTIHLERSSKRLMIRISDDGIGMDEEMLAVMNERLEKNGQGYSLQMAESQGGIALINVNNRIHLLFGEEYGLHVFSMPGVGTDVEISLPAITSDRELEKKSKNET